ncbi:cupin domain-containing protein [Streptomyces sp. NPDC093221]|uniref:cupin domain-containing protein n=1 Tax=Streptomyces sp. NPDC093221 TaxID=3366032 RepID=UPI0037F429D9
MEIFDFDRDERRVTHYKSSGVHATRVAAGDGGPVQLTHLKVTPGGIIGTHTAPSPQAFLMISGSGWIAGPDGVRTPLTAGQGVRWDQDEPHTSGTDTGFTVLAVEGPPLTLFAPDLGTGTEGRSSRRG